MESSEQPNPEIQRQELIKECTGKAWELFIQDIANAKSDRAQRIRINMIRPLSFKIRRFSSWGEKLNKLAQSVLELKSQKYPDFTLEQSKISVMTGNGIYYNLAEYEDRVEDFHNSKGKSYILFMDALRATMPWNRTGSNPKTMKDVKETDLKQALDYMDSRLVNKNGK